MKWAEFSSYVKSSFQAKWDSKLQVEGRGYNLLIQAHVGILHAHNQI